MDRRPSDRVLEEWDSVSRTVQRPVEAPRRRGAFAGMALVPLAAAALIVAVGIAWLGGRESRPNVGASPSPTGSAVAAAVSPTPEPTTATAAPPSPSPEPPSATPGACTISAAITSWEGAAGSRIANLVATNDGAAPCEIPTPTPAQLVDGSGRVLAETGTPLGSTALTLGPGESIHTMTSVSNVCGDPPVAPVTIRLDFGAGRIVTARPGSADDATVPPCNGPGQPSEMSLHGWTR